MSDHEVLLLIISVLHMMWPGAIAAQDNGTRLTVPLLFDPNTRCESAYYSGQFTNWMIVLSQNYHNNSFLQSLVHLHRPRCKTCARCMYKILQPTIKQSVHAFDFNTCHEVNVRNCTSWFTLCDKKVTGLNFQILDDPTITAIYVSLTPSFSRLLAVYPLPTTLPRNGNGPYVYHILHGRQQKRMLKGFTIQNPYDTDTNVSTILSDSARGFSNSSGHELIVPIGSRLSLKCREVLWAEPASNDTDFSSRSLSGTVLSSTTPLSVFTNLAVTHESVGGFSYDSQLVHQMPERRKWGRNFVIDARHSEILPKDIRSCLMHEVTVVSYMRNATISLESSFSSREIDLESSALTTATSEEHHEYRMTSTSAEMLQRVYLKIHSPFPISVLSETFTSSTLSSSCHDSVFYSVLTQPVEWYANKQIIILTHPLTNTTYHYRISVALPNNKSDPADVFESESGDYCHGVSIKNYGVQEVEAVGDDAYTLLIYERSVINSKANQTKLVLLHFDPHTRIGVTVYAYSEGLVYSYSNGYGLDNDFMEHRENCTSATKLNTPYTTPYRVAVSISTVTVTVVIAIIVVVVIMEWRRRWRRKKITYNHLLQPDDDYPYDIFFLCADEDDRFVEELIEEPLKERGYVTMRKNTAPDGLFIPGNVVASDIDRVIKLCSRVIVVCSQNYSSSHESSDNPDRCGMEIGYCKEVMSACNGRVIPIMLDGTKEARFLEFTQHRIKTNVLLCNTKARSAFINRLERDMKIKRIINRNTVPSCSLNNGQSHTKI